MTHEAIIPTGSAPPLAPYSPGVKSGDTVYVSGILAMDSDGSVVGPGDIKAQTRQVIEAIRSVVERRVAHYRTLHSIKYFLQTWAITQK